MMPHKQTVRSLFGLIFIDQTCLTLTFPLLTLIFFDAQSRLLPPETPFATRSLWYGICVALPNIINIFFAPWLSSLSDEIGRKKILLIEIASAMVFTLLLGIGAYWGVLACVFLGFIVKGAFSRTNPTALAIIGDTVPVAKKVLYMGYLQFAISVGACLGPIIGGYLANRFLFPVFNFSLPFFLAALLALSNTVLAACLMRETLSKPPRKPVRLVPFSAIKQVFQQPDVLRISLVLLLIQLSWSTYYQYIPPILKTQYHFDGNQLGTFIGMIAFWLAAATGVGVKLLQRFFEVRKILLIAAYMVLTGFIITLLACNGFLPATKVFIWLGAFPIAAGDVIAYSCLTALYSNVVPQEEQGKVMGICFIVAASAWTCTGFLGGYLMHLTPLLPLIAAPAGVITAILLIHKDFGRKLVLSYSN